MLPFERGAFEAVIRDSGRDAEASLAGFARAWDATRAAMSGTGSATAPASALRRLDRCRRRRWTDALRAAFPAATHEFVEIGYARLVEYQDRAYADLYLERLARILAAERKADAVGAHDFALTRETARFLALWMAFDDIVRVADLKCRASRFARVRSEVAAGPRRHRSHRRLLQARRARSSRRCCRGRWRGGSLPGTGAARRAAKHPLSFALTLAHRQRHRLSSRCARSPPLAGCAGAARALREEQTAIERWLAAIGTAARDDWQLALEIALCGRLVKGYGATSERGKDNLLHILEHLAGKRRAAVGERAWRCAPRARPRLPMRPARRWIRRWSRTAHRRGP